MWRGLPIGREKEAPAGRQACRPPSVHGGGIGAARTSSSFPLAQSTPAHDELGTRMVARRRWRRNGGGRKRPAFRRAARGLAFSAAARYALARSWRNSRRSSSVITSSKLCPTTTSPYSYFAASTARRNCLQVVTDTCRVLSLSLSPLLSLTAHTLSHPIFRQGIIGYTASWLKIYAMFPRSTVTTNADSFTEGSQRA